MYQFTKQEIFQIRQEIKALENEKKMARGGVRVSQTDRQIATNEVAKKYDMTGVALVRMVTVKRNRRVSKAEPVVAEPVVAEPVVGASLLEQLNQKKAEAEARQAEIAELEKAVEAEAEAELEELKKATAAKDYCFKGHFVYVYTHDSKNHRHLVYRIVSRGKQQIHVCYFDNLEKANKVAKNIDNVVLRAIEKLAGDA